MSENTRLAGQPVNKQKRLPGAFIEIVDARTIDFDEASVRRQSLLHLPRRPRGEKGEITQRKCKKHKDDTNDPGERDHRPVSPAGPVASAPA
jgi:hypothetical protein